MKTKMMVFAITVSLFMLCACWVSGDGTSCTEQLTKVYSGGTEAGELTLRFYETTPNVPYLGMNAYSQYMKRQTLTLRQEEDGTCVLVNGTGEELFCDTEEGKIVIQDWGKFFDLPLPLEDEANGWKDTSTHFVRITDVDYEGEAGPVTLDFAKYGINIYADEDDIYLPVSVLSNIMTDIATNYMLYNGENLYVERLSLDGSGIEGFYSSERLRGELRGEKRKDDIIRQSYADLCFNFDYFFGHPGKAVLDEALAEKGLDQALKDLGEEGASIRSGLLSDDLDEYILAMNQLFMEYLSDGHTVLYGIQDLLTDPEVRSDTEKMQKLGIEFEMDILKSPATMKQLLHGAIAAQRQIVWGDEDYREFGSTAIIRLDSFMPDEEAWDQYYKGEGDMPEDCLGIVASGLRKASENPAVENVIFDLSCNNGGSPDVMMAILAMTTGQNQLYGLQKITGQKLTFTFEADTNFDGIYDEQDKNTEYDFNYGVLVTRKAFSCGNLFPIIFQEGGAVLIGESSSGGSCCVQIGTDAEGLHYVMSSAQWQLVDSEGLSVEGGCKVDIPAKADSIGIVDKLLSNFGIDENLPFFEDFFDDAKLDSIMNDWFGMETELENAA